jgi:hypothetical protein
MTLFNSMGYIASDDRMTMNKELVRIWKEAVLTFGFFKVLFQHLSGRTEKNTKSLASNHPVGSDKNPELSKH